MAKTLSGLNFISLDFVITSAQSSPLVATDKESLELREGRLSDADATKIGIFEPRGIASPLSKVMSNCSLDLTRR